MTRIWKIALVLSTLALFLTVAGAPLVHGNQAHHHSTRMAASASGGEALAAIAATWHGETARRQAVAQPRLGR